MERVICLVFLISVFTVHGQQRYYLSGTISDQNGTQIDTGDVLILDKKDQSIVKYTFVDNGKFNFDEITLGKYIVSISCLGYEKEELVIELNDNKVLSIKLKKSAIALDEVTVKAIKNDISFENGNIKVTIENSIFESLPTPTDILSKLPGIQISPDQESIAMIGRGTPLIYLDSQRIDLDQLKSLSVGDIKDIEIIDNPSAKYEAQGRSLILITRKRDLADGYKIQLSEIASFKRRFNNYIGINTNFKKNKLELRANFNYNQIGFWEAADSKTSILNENITSQIEVTSIGPRPQFIASAGLFYSLNKDDYISGQANLRTQTDKFPIRSSTFLQQVAQEDFILTDNKNDEKRNFFSSNINFNKKITSTSNLFFGLQYSNHIRHPKSNIFNNLNETGFELSQNRDQKYEIGVFAGRIDLEKKIGEIIKLEIGGSFSVANALAFSDFEFISPASKEVSKYDYQEDIYASYAQLSGNLNKIKYSAGIRSETNIVKGGFRNELDLLIDREQTRLFPKIKIDIPIDSTKSITLNHNTSINRPSYLNASSISTFISPFSEFSRNVNLKSTITEEISANLQYKKNALYISYYNQNNPVFYTVVFDSENNRTVSSPENFEKESGYQIRFTNTTTYKFWNTTNILTFIHSEIMDPSAISKDVKPYLYYYSNNEFKLTPKTALGINLWGLSKRNQGVFERNAMFILSASFSKTLFKNLNLAINVNDIFRNMNFIDRYTVNDIISENIFYVNAQEISFSVKYSFGKAKKSSFKNKNVDDNLNRM